MLDLANDIRSLSDFKRNTVDLLDRIRATGNPMVLTVNGKAELIVQDAGAYQRLLDRVEALEGIQRRVADVKGGRPRERGRNVPRHESAFAPSCKQAAAVRTRANSQTRSQGQS